MTHASPEFMDSLRDTAIFLPQGPDEAADATLEEIRYWERELVLPAEKQVHPEIEITRDDYLEGTADEPNQLAISNAAMENLLVCAEHATLEKRKSDPQGSDYGTGGLARVLAEHEGVTSIIPRGMLERRAVTDPEGEIKQAIAKRLPFREGFLSLHGMLPGKVLAPDDTREIHALIGLGKQPNEPSRLAAEGLVGYGSDIGLRIVISNDHRHMIYDYRTGELKREADGTPKTGQLAALRDVSTTNFAYEVMADHSLVLPAFQLELTNLLRLLPIDIVEGGWHKDKKALAMGVHLGFLVAQRAVQLMRPTEVKGLVQ